MPKKKETPDERKLVVDYFSTFNKELSKISGNLVNLLGLKADGMWHKATKGGCHAGMAKLPTDLTKLWTSLVRTGTVSAEDALAYWKFMIGPQSPFRNLDAKVSIVYDDKDNPLAYEVELTKSTCLLTLHSLFVSSRIPLERPGCIYLYNNLIKAGVSEVDARFLMFNLESMSPDEDSNIYIAAAGHFAFWPLNFSYDYFVNGSSPQSGVRIGGSYVGNHANFMKKPRVGGSGYSKGQLEMLHIISGKKKVLGKAFGSYAKRAEDMYIYNLYGLSVPPLTMDALAAKASEFIDKYKKEIG